MIKYWCWSAISGHHKQVWEAAWTTGLAPFLPESNWRTRAEDHWVAETVKQITWS